MAAKVRKGSPDECWIWTAKAKTSFGYGRLNAGRGANLKAHRVAWALANGRSPLDLCVCHSCDNPACCNPAHLFLGTKRDNTRDMMSKGRMKAPPVHYGERHHNTKFDRSTAEIIAADCRSAHVVAAEFGISQKTVYRLRKGITWRDPSTMPGETSSRALRAAS